MGSIMRFCPVYWTYGLIEFSREVGVATSAPNEQRTEFYQQYNEDGENKYIPIKSIEHVEGS